MYDIINITHIKLLLLRICFVIKTHIIADKHVNIFNFVFINLSQQNQNYGLFKRQKYKYSSKAQTKNKFFKFDFKMCKKFILRLLKLIQTKRKKKRRMWLTWLTITYLHCKKINSLIKSN